MKLLGKILKWVATLIVSLLLILVGIVMSFSLFPESVRIHASACFVQDFETVFCQRGEDADFFYYRIAAVRGGEVMQIERKIPKRSIKKLDL